MFGGKIEEKNHHFVIINLMQCWREVLAAQESMASFHRHPSEEIMDTSREHATPLADVNLPIYRDGS